MKKENGKFRFRIFWFFFWRPSSLFESRPYFGRADWLAAKRQLRSGHTLATSVNIYTQFPTAPPVCGRTNMHVFKKFCVHATFFSVTLPDKWTDDGFVFCIVWQKRKTKRKKKEARLFWTDVLVSSGHQLCPRRSTTASGPPHLTQTFVLSRLKFLTRWKFYTAKKWKCCNCG